jgi:multidrug transporter EmrE-like cation transporter
VTPTAAKRGRARMMQLAIIVMWAVCFTVLNYGAKRVLLDMPPWSSGLAAIGKYFGLCGWTYLLGVVFVLGAGFYLAALRILPLSAAGPIFLSLGFITTFVLGVAFFKEKISVVQAIGLVTCIVGILLVGWQRGELQAPPQVGPAADGATSISIAGGDTCE